MKPILHIIFPVGFALNLISCSGKRIDYEIKCRNESRQISNSVYRMFADNIQIQENKDISSEIIAYNRNNKHGIFDPERMRINDGKILDPLGRPYHMIFSKKSGELKTWSVGINGINEDGKGDDILFAEQVTESRAPSLQSAPPNKH